MGWISIFCDFFCMKYVSTVYQVVKVVNFVIISIKVVTKSKNRI